MAVSQFVRDKELVQNTGDQTETRLEASIRLFPARGEGPYHFCPNEKYYENVATSQLILLVVQLRMGPLALPQHCR